MQTLFTQVRLCDWTIGLFFKLSAAALTLTCALPAETILRAWTGPAATSEIRTMHHRPRWPSVSPGATGTLQIDRLIDWLEKCVHGLLKSCFCCCFLSWRPTCWAALCTVACGCRACTVLLTVTTMMTRRRAKKDTSLNSRLSWTAWQGAWSRVNLKTLNWYRFKSGMYNIGLYNPAAWLITAGWPLTVDSRHTIMSWAAGRVSGNNEWRSKLQGAMAAVRCSVANIYIQ